MLKLIFCWELGDDLGYLTKALTLRRIFDESIEFYIVARDIVLASELDWPGQVKLLQAPIWLRSHPQASKAESLAEILFYKGYDSHQHLKTLADAWLILFNAIKPDILLFDHAPTALLAASSLKIPKIIVSNPYLTPPPGTQTISLISEQYYNEVKAADLHSHVVTVINHIRVDYGAEPLKLLSDLFDVNATFLSGFSKTDYFSKFRSQVIYCGSALTTSVSTRHPVWKEGFSQKLVGYLKRRDQRSEKILQVLAAMQARALCFYSNSSRSEISQFENSSIVATNLPFNFSEACKQASAVICHGGQGVVNEALYRGIPLILIPTQAEQYFIANKIKSLGSAIVIEPSESMLDIETKLKEFFSNALYQEKASYFAQEVFNIDPDKIQQQLKETLINSSNILK